MRPAHQHLIFPGDVSDQWRRVRLFGRPRFSPLDFARLAMQRRHESAVFVIGSNDHQRLIDGRRGSIAVAQIERAGIRLPELVAFEVESGQPYRIAIEKRCEDARAVDGNRRRGMRTFVVSQRPRQAPFVNGLLPKLPSGLAVETDDRLRPLILIGSRQKHPVAKHRRRGMPSAGNRRFPEDVFRLAPGDRHVDSAGDAVAGRAAPERPIIGAEGRFIDRFDRLAGIDRYFFDRL